MYKAVGMLATELFITAGSVCNIVCSLTESVLVPLARNSQEKLASDESSNGLGESGVCLSSQEAEAGGLEARG